MKQKDTLKSSTRGMLEFLNKWHQILNVKILEIRVTIVKCLLEFFKIGILMINLNTLDSC